MLTVRAVWRLTSCLDRHRTVAVSDDVVIRSRMSVQVNLGYAARDCTCMPVPCVRNCLLTNQRGRLRSIDGHNTAGLAGSLSGQIATLRQLLRSETPTQPWTDVVSGSIPLIVGSVILIDCYVCNDAGVDGSLMCHA